MVSNGHLRGVSRLILSFNYLKRIRFSFYLNYVLFDLFLDLDTLQMPNRLDGDTKSGLFIAATILGSAS